MVLGMRKPAPIKPCYIAYANHPVHGTGVRRFDVYVRAKTVKVVDAADAKYFNYTSSSDIGRVDFDPVSAVERLQRGLQDNLLAADHQKQVAWTAVARAQALLTDTHEQLASGADFSNAGG